MKVKKLVRIFHRQRARPCKNACSWKTRPALVSLQIACKKPANACRPSCNRPANACNSPATSLQLACNSNDLLRKKNLQPPLQTAAAACRCTLQLQEFLQELLQEFFRKFTGIFAGNLQGFLQGYLQGNQGGLHSRKKKSRAPKKASKFAVFCLH